MSAHDKHSKKKKRAFSNVSPRKARKMLHEGTAHGRPITDAQRRALGARSRQKG